MAPRTRLDKVVELRGHAEDRATVALARARATVDHAHHRLDAAREVTARDGRGSGPVELWDLDERARRRALQAVRAAEADLAAARNDEARARQGWIEAHRDTEVVRRVQERKRAEIRGEHERLDRRAADELATLRFNAAR